MRSFQAALADVLKWWRWPLALAGGLIALLALSGGSYSAPDNVHGAVYSWTAENPGQNVPLIVETDDADAVAALIDTFGGSVQRQFQIIPAVEADLPARFIPALASHPSVAWLSLDAPVLSTNAPFNTNHLATAYPFAVGADSAWSRGFFGAGVGVAVVDTGISPRGHEDFKSPDGTVRVIAETVFSSTTSNLTDGYGHGTHIAGTVAGDGSLLSGRYIGIAPSANLINVKVSDDGGNATLGSVIAGLEFVHANRDVFNIRVANLSLTSSVAQSYKTDPLCAAAEFLWFSGIFVVAAAGNLGTAPDAVNYCPGNDPFIMTVGASDDRGTPSTDDDVVAEWSSRGATQDGFAKPELVAPGRNIVSVIDTNSILYNTYPDKIVDKDYFRLSGTSMAAGVMSGVAALLFDPKSTWTPTELKCTLISEARSLGGGAKIPSVGRVLSDDSPDGGCNDRFTPGFLLLGALPVVAITPVLGAVGALPAPIAYVLGQPNSKAVAAEIGLDLAAANIQGASLNSVDWSTIKWDAINWDAIKWDAIKWGSINWDAIKWGAIKWDAIKWDLVNWDAIKWGAIKWDAIKWDAIKWGAIKWDAIKWSAIKWGAIKWDAIKWSAIKWSAIKWSDVNWDAIKWDAIKWSDINWDAIKWSEINPADIGWSAIKWSAIKWSAIKWSAIKWSAIKWSSSVQFEAIKWSAIKWSFFAQD